LAERYRAERHLAEPADLRRGWWPEAGNTGATSVVQTREFYGSANGDRWLLVRDPGSGRVFVRHEPNASSGGRASDIEVGAFLSRDAHGPEHQELLRLIGTLVEDAPLA
jgi:hypothetical protein